MLVQWRRLNWLLLCGNIYMNIDLDVNCICIFYTSIESVRVPEGIRLSP